MNIELLHLGDQCAPGILIQDILGEKTKKLFMLAFFPFNNIIKYIKSDNYKTIYDNQYLSINKDNHVEHTLYKFRFNHDYKINNNKIINYNHISARFNEKIQNFKSMMSSDSIIIGITFTDSPNSLHISEMMNELLKRKPNRKVYCIIYSYAKYTLEQYPNVYHVKLLQSYDKWWEIPLGKRYKLYKEIYEQFLHVLSKWTLQHNYPDFNSTEYGKQFNSNRA